LEVVVVTADGVVVVVPLTMSVDLLSSSLVDEVDRDRLVVVVIVLLLLVEIHEHEIGGDALVNLLVGASLLLPEILKVDGPTPHENADERIVLLP
jgi:hypothetical protein